MSAQHPTEQSTLRRRRFLAGAAGSLGGLALASSTSQATTRQGATHQDDVKMRFALLGDTQIEVDLPARTEWTKWVYEQIASRDPRIVCHVGDIVEHGSVDEYNTYLGTIPDHLRSRMRHVPGNHEWRWDPTAGERYRSLFGPQRYSFDVAGVHFVALDPSHLLQEPGGFGEWGIRWLERDLRRTRPGVPIVLLSHFPFAGDNYYVSDQERLLEVLDRYNVRVVFAGHVHSQEIGAFNGVMQLAVDDTRGAPTYYWVEYVRDHGGPVLRISVVHRSVDGEPDETPVVEIPLGGDRPGHDVRPRATRLDAEGAALVVSGRLGRSARDATVQAQLFPQHTYGLKDAGDWHDFAVDAQTDRFDGSLDIAGLPPGRHRATVKVVGADGDWYERTLEYEVPGDHRRIWQRDLRAPIQAALVNVPNGSVRGGESFIAATTAGTVFCAGISRNRPRRRWVRKLGPVHGAPVLTPEGDTVFVPSTDHHVYALDVSSGRPRFSYDAGEPVLGSPVVTEVSGRTIVAGGAGEGRYAIDAGTGDEIWTSSGQGMFAGRAASDGERIYTGGGDGRAYAYDAATGGIVWSFLTNTRDGTYRRLIYGPWYDNIELIPGELVLVSTVTGATALDAATGELTWDRSGSYIYAPTYVVGDNLLMIDDWLRTASLVESATGELLWTVDIGVRVLNTGAVVRDGTAWIQGTTGLLVALDLETGMVSERLQLTTTAYCYSTPVVVDDVLVVGDQDGVLHGIEID